MAAAGGKVVEMDEAGGSLLGNPDAGEAPRDGKADQGERLGPGHRHVDGPPGWVRAVATGRGDLGVVLGGAVAEVTGIGRPKARAAPPGGP